jgi:hypothetical protein
MIAAIARGSRPISLGNRNSSPARAVSLLLDTVGSA